MKSNKQSEIIVVKVGTDTISRDNGRLSLDFMEDLAQQISAVMEQTKQRIILVSSGAVGVGKIVAGKKLLNPINGDNEDKDIRAKQVLASLGQHKLMRYWEVAFSEAQPSRLVSQLLPDIYTFQIDVLKENFRRTLLNTPEWAVPIINENDSQATEELKFGDNDTLAARVASLMKAKALILLTNVDGLFDKNPNEHVDAQIVKNLTVAEIDHFIKTSCNGKSNGGTGGMESKLEASKIACEADTITIIANGRTEGILQKILIEGDFVGTTIN